MTDLYDIGDRPPLGVVPQRMHAYAVRQNRFGQPRDAWRREVIPFLLCGCTAYRMLMGLAPWNVIEPEQMSSSSGELAGRGPDSAPLPRDGRRYPRSLTDLSTHTGRGWRVTAAPGDRRTLLIVAAAASALSSKCLPAAFPQLHVRESSCDYRIGPDAATMPQFSHVEECST